jgi:S1-C subfamily serine protease
MSIHQALEQLRPCTCAIGYLTKSPEKSVGDIHSSSFRILGSGFLVSAGVVVTNRHVVLALEAKIKELRLPANRCIAQFAYGSQQVFKFLTGHGFLANKLDKARSDIGYLSFSTQDDVSHPFIQPAKIGSELIVDVGDPVGVYGYPYGKPCINASPVKKKLSIGSDRYFNKALSQAWHPSTLPK